MKTERSGHRGIAAIEGAVVIAASVALLLAAAWTAGLLVEKGRLESAVESAGSVPARGLTSPAPDGGAPRFERAAADAYLLGLADVVSRGAGGAGVRTELFETWDDPVVGVVRAEPRGAATAGGRGVVPGAAGDDARREFPPEVSGRGGAGRGLVVRVTAEADFPAPFGVTDAVRLRAARVFRPEEEF